jgi:hypothetical protein
MRTPTLRGQNVPSASQNQTKDKKEEMFRVEKDSTFGKAASENPLCH